MDVKRVFMFGLLTSDVSNINNGCTAEVQFHPLGSRGVEMFSGEERQVRLAIHRRDGPLHSPKVVRLLGPIWRFLGAEG